MAATLTDAPQDIAYFSFPIEKVDKTPDGDLIVRGIASDPGVDSDEQIVDDKFSSKAIADWLASGANVRVQHNPQLYPAGVGIEAETDGTGATWVKSLIVEPTAKRLVEKGVLRAYSVGIARPKIVRDSVARGGRIVDGAIVEISLVDRPANKSCGIQLVKSADDGTPQFTGKLFGSDLLTKGETVNVDLPRDVSVSFSPADLAKLLKHRQVAEDRMAQADTVKDDLSTDERNNLDDKHFAYIDSKGGRHLPVHDAGHVKSALGRFNQQQFESDDAKRKAAKKILSRAKSMGIDVDDDSNVAQAAKMLKGAVEKKGKKGKPFPGAAPAFDNDKDGDGQVDETQDPDVEKGAKDCPKCGKGFHADSKLRACDKCGADLPNANKSADVDDDDTDGEGGDNDSGQPMPVDKSGKPTPGHGVTGTGAADIKPVPAHREPDGDAIEDYEHDAGLPTVPDSSVKSGDAEIMAVMRMKALGVPVQMGALHDLMCAAYHPSEASAAHPSHSLSAMDTGVWQAKALDAATGAPIDEAMAASALWQHAVTIKNTDADELADIRWEAHKAFQDANPGPGTFPSPTELSPRSFNRPYLSAGHAAASPGQEGPNTATVPSGQTTANSFTRPYLDAGHAADSPSNKDATPAPLPAGEPSRVYYRNAQRDNAKQAMQAMHDHIAATFPDLCPMNGPGRGGEPPLGQRPVPVPEASKSEDGATVTVDLKGAQVLSEADMDTLVQKIGKAMGAQVKIDVPVAKAVTPDLVKSAVAEAVSPMMARLDEIKQELDAERKRTKALQKAVDALGGQPDPNVAAYKGAAVYNPMLAKAAGVPVGQPSMSEIAERTQMTALSALQDQARHDPDPAQREAAWARIYQMTGLTAPR